MDIHRIGRDAIVLNDQLEVPGVGFLAVNAFVLQAAEPVVIDTGLSLPDRNFVESLGAVMDPADVRWIWLTHPDRDHTGGLFDLLDAAPQARVVTTFIGAGIMSTERPLPMDRVYLLNPGQSLDVGDRTLHGFRPPLFDNPATVGFYDDRSGSCFSSDCFGAPVPSAGARAGSSDGQRRPGRRAPGRAIALGHRRQPLGPRGRSEVKYLETVEPMRAMDPAVILSSSSAAGRRADPELPRHARRGAGCRSFRRTGPAARWSRCSPASSLPSFRLGVLAGGGTR